MTQNGNFKLMLAFFAGAVFLFFVFLLADRCLNPDSALLYKTTVGAMVGGGGLFATKGTVGASETRTKMKAALKISKAVAPDKYGRYLDAAGAFLGEDEENESDGAQDVEDNDDESEVRL
jgi:hypothetical protein